jgi:starvation-inducible DNA-binding protein
MNQVAKNLSILMADTYALYLKTQNYHWHVRGPQFRALHELFDTQYHELADAVDEIAERMLALGYHAPASFKAFEALKTITDGDSNANANQMLKDLATDHGALIRDLNQSIALAQAEKDEGTAALLSDRIAAHEKARWMLNASAELA